MEDNIVKATITANDTNTINSDINVESSQNNITKSIISNNNGENILETMILPVNPITQEHQQYLLYVPVATAGRHIGISSYNDDDFIVNNKGFVKLALSRQSIIKQFSDVNLKIDNEISRAREVESTLNLKIDNEVSRAREVESTLNIKIDNETIRAKEAESKLSARIEEINADMDFDNYYNKNEVNELFVTNTALEEKHYATEDYVNLNGGKIDKIKVNGTEQTIINKEVDLIVPVKYSELLNDNNTVEDANYVHTDNNYTNEEKEKLSTLNNYDDTDIKNLINTTNENTKSYADTKINTLKEELLGPGTSEAIDTIYELADALAENADVVKALDDAIAKKANQTALDTLNLAIGNKVNKTLKINGKTLEQDINLTAADVGALSSFTETDPTVPSHVKNITTTDISNWNNKLSSVPSVYKTKTENDALYQAKGNYLTSFTETDPTVPAWAKEPTKPSYNYSEINNTPTIPTVNDATILITQGGNVKGSFTLNQSTGVHIDLDAGGGGSNVTLYETTGQNTDGAMTQKATTDELNKRVEFEDFDEIEFTPNIQSQIDSINNQLTSTQNELTNKANVNLSNIIPEVKSASATVIGKTGTKRTGNRVVVESWNSNDGEAWYRKWSDGWKECGFTFITNTQGVKQFPITFTQRPTCIATAGRYDSEELWGPGGNAGVVTINLTSPYDSAYIWCGTSSSNTCCRVYCCGY